jgi:hypothetical protein
MTIITIAKTIIAAATTTTTAPKASAEERKRIATGRQARRGGTGALGFAIIPSNIMILHGHHRECAHSAGEHPECAPHHIEGQLSHRHNKPSALPFTVGI